MRRYLIFFSIMVAFLTGISFVENAEALNMKLTSPDFENNSYIPKNFTCQGQGINPSLLIALIPENAKSLALIVDDPDATIGTWVHWVVYNIPITGTIKENSTPGTQGITSSGGTSYHGPCPPSGTHRYFFTVYALDAALDPQEEIDAQGLENIMRSHILGRAELIGLYKKT